MRACHSRPVSCHPRQLQGTGTVRSAECEKRSLKSTAIYFVYRLLSNGSSPLGNQTSRGRKKKTTHNGDNICSSLRTFTVHADFFAKLISPIAKKWRQKQVLAASQLLQALLPRRFSAEDGALGCTQRADCLY